MLKQQTIAYSVGGIAGACIRRLALNILSALMKTNLIFGISSDNAHLINIYYVLGKSPAC